MLGQESRLQLLEIVRVRGFADAWRTTLESAGVGVLVAGEGSRDRGKKV